VSGRGADLLSADRHRSRITDETGAENGAREQGPPPTRRRRPGRGVRAGATLAVLALALLGAAVGLYLRTGPAVSLRIPAGWHMVRDPAGAGLRPHAGRISLAGPFGATFRVSWGTEKISSECTGDCETVPELHPLATTLNGLPVTLRPFPQPYHRLILQPVRDEVAGRTLYFSLSCHPPLPSVEKVCADIVSSVEVGRPLLQHLRLDRAIVPIS
jgi:hypothetical protein